MPRCPYCGSEINSIKYEEVIGGGIRVYELTLNKDENNIDYHLLRENVIITEKRYKCPICEKDLIDVISDLGDVIRFLRGNTNSK